MVSSGFGLWMVWSGTLNTAVTHTLRDYGVLLIKEEPNQALWYSHSPEVFRALARLQVWARLNPMSVFCQVLPVTFLVGYGLEISVSAPTEFARQQVDPPDEFEVWIHPKLKESVASVTGLDLVQAGSVPGLASAGWMRLAADSGLDYESTLSWFFVIKPLGRMGDKESIIGWRDFFSEVQGLLQRMTLKYVTDIKDGFVVIPLDNFRTLRTFCQEMLNLVQAAKAAGKSYWPCVMVAVPQKGLPFSTDLPRKVNLDWNRLTPEFPHLQYRDAFLLSDAFKVNEIRQAVDQESLESWCNIGLKDGGGAAHGTPEVVLPRRLVAGGEGECFYCGLKSHKAAACPTRTLSGVDGQVWQRLGLVCIKEFPEGFKALGELLDPAKPAQGIETLLGRGERLEGLLTKAILEINVPSQLRQLELVWRSRGKEWPDGLEVQAPEEGEFIWAALAMLRAGDREQADGLLKQANLKYQRSYQPHSLQGFVAMESGDLNQALFYWQESERHSYTPLQQGYFFYLQGRLLEVKGELKEAVGLFKRAYQTSPRWLDPLYRQAACMVKMGFTGHALDLYFDLIEQDPSMFNRILVDPELDRGRLQILSALWDKWSEAAALVNEAKEQVARYALDIAQRYDEDNEYFGQASAVLERLKKQGEISNYVAFRQIVEGIRDFAARHEAHVGKEIKRINRIVDILFDRLKEIQDEAAWFPFPKLLLEFNRDFNFCVEKIRWIKSQHLKIADNFRRATRFTTKIEERIDTLRSRLVTLRLVRDSTLFVLLLGRNFIWFEIIGLGLALVTLPAFIFLTRGMEHNWLVEAVLTQKWEFQKALILIVSVIALLLASVRSAFTFDRRKRELFERTEEALREERARRRAEATRAAAAPRPVAKKAPAKKK
jgi:tetratricopeptide (TPR) repeat protein